MAALRACRVNSSTMARSHPRLPFGVGTACWTCSVLHTGTKIVGWSMATHLRTELVLDAPNMAITIRKPEGVVHHSDQGCQYTSIAFGMRCKRQGVRPSVGSVGDCYDNAMCERAKLGREPRSQGGDRPASSSPRWSARSSSGRPSRPRPRPRWSCSASSRASTAPAGVTLRSATWTRMRSSGGTSRRLSALNHHYWRQGPRDRGSSMLPEGQQERGKNAGLQASDHVAPPAITTCGNSVRGVPSAATCSRSSRAASITLTSTS
jgi:hypothetical protein